MKNTIRRLLCCSALCGSIAMLTASPPVIGVARSWGAFWINDASVPGSATILDGTSLKTGDASSDINLTNGTRVTMSSNSSATVHNDRLLLDRGTAEFSGTAAYRVEALHLRIGASDSVARVRVGVDRRNRVLVASLGGSAEVRNAQGLLVAHILAGAALTLSASDSTAVELTGTVQRVNGKFLLTDNVSKVTVELHGSALKSLVGKQVHITGTLSSEPAAAGAPQAVTVTSATPVGTAAGAGGAAAGAGAVSSSFPTIAIIGGVAAVGGTLGGLAATGVIGAASSVSR